MKTYKRFVHPEYNWYNKTLKVINEDLFITSDGEIKTHDELISLIHNMPIGEYGIIDDDGSFELKFMNELLDNIATHEASIAKTKAVIMQLKNIGGIK